MSRHAKMTSTDGGVHSSIAYFYADKTTREGATGFTTEDVGKLACQVDTGSIWMLMVITPVWEQFTFNGFANGGESFGAARTLGNNDAYSLGWKTNNVIR